MNLKPFLKQKNLNLLKTPTTTIKMIKITKIPMENKKTKKIKARKEKINKMRRKIIIMKKMGVMMMDIKKTKMMKP